MKVVALLSSDLHFSHTPPVARSAEPDWYDAMRRPLNQIKALLHKHRCQWIVAGDIFDRWNSSPQLINFLIQCMPKCHAIVGQHDLSYHVYEDIHKTAFNTLEYAGIVKRLYPSIPNLVTSPGADILAYAFPWGFEIAPLEHRDPNHIQIAICHAYIWKEGYGYPDAPEEKRATQYRQKLTGYDCALFGDNHKGFLIGSPGKFQLLNCGTFMCRKSDERDYKPQVGLLFEDGHIEVEYLDTSEDRWLEESFTQRTEPGDFDVSRFIQDLQKLGSDSLDYKAAVKHRLDVDDVDQDVRKVVLESLGC